MQPVNAELDITDPLTTAHIEQLEHSYGGQEALELQRLRLELMGLFCTENEHPQLDFAEPVVWASAIVDWDSLEPTYVVIPHPRRTSPRAGGPEQTVPAVSQPSVVLGFETPTGNPEVGTLPPPRSVLLSRSNARAKPSALARLRQRWMGTGTTRGLERPGLCVVCREKEAIMAVIDCGHLAMCKDCSQGVMSTSRSCPLCRQRIGEARLIRIFKT
ncbi:E3 ubiquitin-protein ligase cblA [Mycena sanguinolenta]|uniref:E3 ubiquitin-protein ligase cblA n=1 Tax=Mycena sanguinolenta TaxID=230812 RepID=A0A8H7D734_9AGAR|nr:E3 ubiquitin-protein ligase cblA [Mycena sanguinolenta]